MSKSKVAQLHPDVLRETRRRNYWLKRDAGWTCDVDGCTQDRQLLVVRDKDTLAVRCARHRDGLEVEPGQWIDAKPLPPDEAA